MSDLKPRIWFEGGRWWCCTGTIMMSGRTPNEAFARTGAFYPVEGKDYIVDEEFAGGTALVNNRRLPIYSKDWVEQ